MSASLGFTIDRGENLYGTTAHGGSAGYGVAFRLSPHNSSWIFNPLYNFHGTSDGDNPYATVCLDVNEPQVPAVDGFGESLPRLTTKDRKQEKGAELKRDRWA